MIAQDYLRDKLKAYGVTDSMWYDVSMDLNIDLSANVLEYTQEELGIALIRALEELILSPRMGNVNEGGFSLSWNYDSVGRYYLWLCRRWKQTPNTLVTEATGLNTISDKTNAW